MATAPTTEDDGVKASAYGCINMTFITRAGEARTVVSSVNRPPPPWKVGEAVEIVYDPAEPGRADLRTELTNWRLWFGIGCAVALLPLAIALPPVVAASRHRRKRQRAAARA